MRQAAEFMQDWRDVVHHWGVLLMAVVPYTRMGLRAQVYFSGLPY